MRPRYERSPTAIGELRIIKTKLNMPPTTDTAAAPVAKYKELKFTSDDAFNAWLNKTAKKLIWFKDEGQDCICFWIDEHGEVLHMSYSQTSIWNGKFVNVETLKPGEPVQMYFEHEGWRTLIKLTVDEIETL